MKKKLKWLLPTVIILALLVASFCIFAFATPGAQVSIGENDYATLADAIDAINTGVESPSSVIKLNQDITSSTAAQISQSMTIDLNGYNIVNTADSASDYLFTVAGDNITLSVTGEGSITTNAGFARIADTAGANAKINMSGTASGIMVSVTGTTPAIDFGPGGGSFENSHFLLSGAVGGSNSAYMLLSGTSVSFKKCNIYSTGSNKYTFAYTNAGASASFDGCFISSSRAVFLMSQTEALAGDGVLRIDLNNAPDFVMLDAKDSIFYAVNPYTNSGMYVHTNTSIIAGTSRFATPLSGTVKFAGCDLTAYRVIELGSASTNDDGSTPGDIKEGYTFNVIAEDSVLRTHYSVKNDGSGKTNAPQILRGTANFNAKNCKFDIDQKNALFSGVGFGTPKSVVLDNCRLNYDASADVGVSMALQDTSYAMYYDPSDSVFPYVVAKTTAGYTNTDGKYMSRDFSEFFKELESVNLVSSSGSTFGQVGNINSKSDSLLFGQLNPVHEGHNTYFKYTFTNSDGTIPDTPTQVSYGRMPFIVVGDASSPTTFPYKNYATIIAEIDFKVENITGSKIAIMPQSRDAGGTNALGSEGVAAFYIQNGKIGDVTLTEGEWHKLSFVITPSVDASTGYADATTYLAYIDGTPIFSTAKKPVKANIANPLFQGIRFGMSSGAQMAGSSIAFDNMTVRAYATAPANTANLIKEKPYITSSAASNQFFSSLDDAVAAAGEGGFVNTWSADAVNTSKSYTLVGLNRFNALTKDTLTPDSSSGIIDNASGKFYGNFLGWQENFKDTAEARGSVSIRLVSPFNATFPKYTCVFAISDFNVLNSSGAVIGGGDGELEFKSIIESLSGENTIQLNRDMTIASTRILLSSTSRNVISLDLAGHTLNRTTKNLFFEDLGNITFNLYSSVPGGVLNARGVFNNSVSPDDKYYKFTTDFAAAVFYVKGNDAILNFGSYKSYSGDNLTVNAGILTDVVATASGTAINVNGGTYVRNVSDSRALFSTRGISSTLSLKDATLLSTTRYGACLFNIEHSSSATLVADNCSFFSTPKSDGTAVSLFTCHSANASSTFTNCRFSNITTKPAEIKTATETPAKVTIGAGNTYCQNTLFPADYTEFASGVSVITLPTPVSQSINGSNIFSFSDVVATSNTPSGKYFTPDTTYYVYKQTNASGIFLLVTINAAPGEGDFQVVYGNVANAFTVSGESYTLKTDVYATTMVGYSGEAVRPGYIVSAGREGEITDANANVLTLPNIAYATVSAGQSLLTWNIGNDSISEVRDSANTDAPASLTLPMADAGFYHYTWNAGTPVDISGTAHITYTPKVAYDFLFSAAVKFEDSFNYIVYVPKDLVDSGKLSDTATYRGKVYNIKEGAIYNDGTKNYYTLLLDGVYAASSGEKVTAYFTANLNSEALTDTAECSFTISMPKYAQALANNNTTANYNEAVQMILDALYYVKGAAEYAGSIYTTSAGYADVLTAIADIEGMGFSASDLSAIDFTAEAKTPTYAGVGDAISGVTFFLKSSTVLRMVLSEGYEGTITLTYTDISGAPVSKEYEIIEGKCGELGYIDLPLGAHYVSSDITITFTSQASASENVYNLASYIANSTDASATALAKALYAYSKSAKAYKAVAN